MVHSMSQSKLPQKYYHCGFFSFNELETKPVTFYHHTLKYHNTQDEKIKQEQIFEKI